MRAKLINDAHGERTFALIFDKGDEVVSTIEAFAAEHQLVASRMTAIGALESVTLGYFNWETKEYDRNEFDEQVEVLSMIGDLAHDGKKVKLHAHIVLGRRDSSAIGGHLLHAIVRPTLEVLLIDSPSYLKRVKDPESGLALIKIGR